MHRLVKSKHARQIWLGFPRRLPEAPERRTHAAMTSYAAAHLLASKYNLYHYLAKVVAWHLSEAAGSAARYWLVRSLQPVAQWIQDVKVDMNTFEYLISESVKYVALLTDSGL